MEQKPMLALPMGKADWEKGSRWDFLKSCQPILENLGWCIGVELKSKGNDTSLWMKDCIQAVRNLGGRTTWHWPNSVGKELVSDHFSTEVILMAKMAKHLKDYGLEAATIHCAPAVSVDPPEDAGLERYNSPIGATKMFKHIKAQVKPLRRLNELTGGILHIENVDITNFRGGGFRVPTYLQLQTGCWQDLLWLARKSGVKVTFDSEHFFCASNLLGRDKEHNNLPDSRPTSTKIQRQLADITGYRLGKGYIPANLVHYSLNGFIDTVKPRLYHFGGALRSVDEEGRIATHAPFDSSSLRGWFQGIIRYQLRRIVATNAVGAVIEVTGQLDPEKYSEWSPRPLNDEVAKMQTYLTVIDEIERLQLEH